MKRKYTKKGNSYAVTEDQKSFIFYKAGYDAAVKISDRCMQYWNDLYHAVKDVFHDISTGKRVPPKEICLDAYFNLCDRVY